MSADYLLNDMLKSVDGATSLLLLTTAYTHPVPPQIGHDACESGFFPRLDGDVPKVIVNGRPLTFAN